MTSVLDAVKYACIYPKTKQYIELLVLHGSGCYIHLLFPMFCSHLQVLPDMLRKVSLNAVVHEPATSCPYHIHKFVRIRVCRHVTRRYEGRFNLMTSAPCELSSQMPSIADTTIL